MKRYLLLLVLIGLFSGVANAQRGQRKQELEKLRKQFIEEKLRGNSTNMRPLTGIGLAGMNETVADPTPPAK